MKAHEAHETLLKTCDEIQGDRHLSYYTIIKLSNPRYNTDLSDCPFLSSLIHQKLIQYIYHYSYTAYFSAESNKKSKS